ncbi:pentapeptide repeat-containing protein [Gammaproteobacteria bacterium]|nr:pentapeptide repeat-containing protein [Gammaproteobacteria bacterium]
MRIAPSTIYPNRKKWGTAGNDCGFDVPKPKPPPPPPPANEFPYGSCEGQDKYPPDGVRTGCGWVNGWDYYGLGVRFYIKPNAELRDARIGKLDLSGANLSGANLTGTRLTNNNLTGANLSKVRLNTGNLSNSNLRSADLSHANLFRVHLVGADLTDADLRGTNLDLVNLTGATLTGVIADSSTVCTEETWDASSNMCKFVVPPPPPQK